MKKILKITLLSVLGVIAVLTACVWMEFGDLVQGARSVQKLDDGLYYMEYSGDDGWDELIEQGGINNYEELANYVVHFLSKGHFERTIETKDTGFGCSALTVQTPSQGVLMGRNFDFPSATGVVLRTRPTRGYSTITTFNIEFFNFGEDFKPEGFTNQYLTLSCLFSAVDGINEKGLAIADLMAGDKVQTRQNTGRPSLNTTGAIPYMLKNAATVEEALSLLRGLDVFSDIGAAHHFAIADASGRSVVVEYVDNEMVVVESPVVANHYLCEAKRNVGLHEGDLRYEKLCRRYEQADGVMDEKALTEAIEEVTQTEVPGTFLGTAWTMVMDLKHPAVTYYSRRHFDKPFRFEL